MMHSTTLVDGPHRWHLRQSGTGPSILLLHGTGADSTSWEPIAPLLAPHWSLLAPDLPGHGASEPVSADALTLPALVAAITGLLRTFQQRPVAIIGHSAGAAIALALTESLGQLPVVGIAPALSEPPAVLAGPARWLGRALAGSDTALRWLAHLGHQPRTARLIFAQARATVSADRLRHYTDLISQPAHLRAALTLMAEWRLASLEQTLPRLTSPVLLLAGSRDPWYPPRIVQTFADRLPHAACATIPDAGHLPHEEQPARTAEMILTFLRP